MRHATSPYIRYRRGRTAPMSLYLCIVGIVLRSETKNLCVDRGSPCVRVRSNNQLASFPGLSGDPEWGKGLGTTACACAKITPERGNRILQ